VLLPVCPRKERGEGDFLLWLGCRSAWWNPVLRAVAAVTWEVWEADYKITFQCCFEEFPYSMWLAGGKRWYYVFDAIF